MSPHAEPRDRACYARRGVRCFQQGRTATILGRTDRNRGRYNMRGVTSIRGMMALALVFGAQAIAADWPQHLGPGRDGIYAGPPLNETWGASGPPVVWRRPVGQGLSGPIVVQNRVILFHRVGDRETVDALDAADG